MSDDDCEEVIDEAEELGYCEAGVRAAERAVQIAEAAEDEAQMLEAYQMLVSNGVHGGFPEKALVAFTNSKAYSSAGGAGRNVSWNRGGPVPMNEAHDRSPSG